MQEIRSIAHDQIAEENDVEYGNRIKDPPTKITKRIKHVSIKIGRKNILIIGKIIVQKIQIT